MQTIHEQSAQSTAEAFAEEPEGRRLLDELAASIRSHKEPLVPIVAQHCRWRDGELWALLQIKMMVATGHLRLCALPVLSTPRRDVEWQDNERLLNAGLADLDCHAVVAKASSGNDADGRVTWNVEPNHYQHPDGADATLPAIGGPGAVRCTAPLEIGTTMASRSKWHIIEEGGLARWPYRHEFLYLLIADEELSMWKTRSMEVRHTGEPVPQLSGAGSPR